MHPTNNTTRVAGLLYLLVAITGAVSLMYVPLTLIEPGKATATANNILASETLFRIGIVSALISGTAFILLVMALYRLLNGVSKTHASLMVNLVLVSVAITFLNEVNNVAALTLFRGADFLAVFGKPQRDALGMLFLRLHSQGNFINEIFWGLWLFPFGVLVMRSRFLPRILGILLIVNCFAYVAASLTRLLLPSYGNVVFRATLPALLGEVWIILWLLIKGVKVQPSAAAAS
ncbi:MAG TPA: DUF4386 domain-containing protein [Acidobacteriota bacterium]|jgi:hypothetical protein